MLQHFDQYGDALAFAKDKGNSQITYKDYRLWRNKSNRKRAAYIDDVPMILQYPELPRGCEVTSLAMLLNFAGVEVDKMKLADEVRKDPTPFSKKENVTTFGNPYDGFVGDMYSLDNPGLGVYHGPIRNLAEKYLPGQIVDMTEASFEDILYPVSQGAPVWVIVPSTYDIVPEEQWQTWETPTGTINVTRKMHSVIIVGYDDQYIHVNDPYGRVSQLPRKNFQKGWEQMGRQAITFIPE